MEEGLLHQHPRALHPQNHQHPRALHPQHEKRGGAGNQRDQRGRVGGRKGGRDQRREG